ncbi:MAG: hypothetical protein DWQ04_24355 [Chloroflexi bacterium]|nr:MAG: hypothetical protein DWQ04_24355 [Chloroflexota bacterium]
MVGWLGSGVESYTMTAYRLPFTAYRLRLLAITWLTAVFRMHSLFANSFHADEALFAGWARLIAVWRDPLLMTAQVDKPPLLFYLQAFFFPLQGPVEWAARLPNFIASILLIPLVAVWVRRWWGEEETAVLAALFVAISPLHIQFSATGFTDPLLTTLLVGAIAIGGGNKKQKTGNGKRETGCDQQLTINSQQLIIYSGLLFVLAGATKHQAWLFLPLVVGTAVLFQWRWWEWRRWLVGFLPVLLLVWGWEFARTGTFTLWSRQISNFGGLRIIWSWELWPRLQSWWGLIRMIWGWGITTVFLLTIPIWLIRNYWTRKYAEDAEIKKKSTKSLINYSFDWLLGCFVLGYFLLHWFLAVPVWDRYLLPLVPILAVLAARSLVGLVSIFNAEVQRRGGFFFASLHLCVYILFVGALLVQGWWGRNGRFPIGGQVDADQGAAMVAEWLDDAPYGTVLYDHWYSWQWNYHLFDKRVFVHWFPYPDALAEDLTAFGRDGNPRYLVVPDADVAIPVRRAVQSSGFRLETVPLLSESGMILYRIVPEN